MFVHSCLHFLFCAFFIGFFLHFTMAVLCSLSDRRLSNSVLWQTWNCWAPFCSFWSLPCWCIAEGLRTDGKQPVGLPAPLTGPPATLLQCLDAYTAAQQCCQVPFSFRYPPQHLIHYHWLPVKTGKKKLILHIRYSFFLLIYQVGYTLFSLSLLTNVPVELLVIFHILLQVKLHLYLDFSDPISACPESVPVFFPGNSSLFPLPVLLFSLSDHQVLAQPCLFPALSTQFLHWLCHWRSYLTA